ncbi:MAG: DUF4158 domain-containing protein [Thiohalocapsa sp.]
MPRRAVLSAAQRSFFEALPTASVELAKHYLLSDEDLALVRERRRQENRLGFAVQLCLSRFPGRLLRVGENPPLPLIRFIADQVGADASAFGTYAKRAETRREHALLLLERFALTTFKSHHIRELVRWLVPIAVDSPSGNLLVGAVLNELRQRRILHPELAVIERLVGVALGRADHRVLRQGKQRQAESLQSDAKQIKQALGMFARLGKALIEARDQQREPWESIEAVLSWEALCSMIDTIETFSQPRRLDALGYVDAFYPQIPRYAPAMLEKLDFQAAAGGGNDVLAAIRLLKTRNATGKRKLPEDAPMSFASPKWEPFVRTAPRCGRTALVSDRRS